MIFSYVIHTGAQLEGRKTNSRLQLVTFLLLHCPMVLLIWLQVQRQSSQTEKGKMRMTNKTQSFAGKTTSFVMGKKEFQNLRRDFKKQGFEVAKVSGGMYELRHAKNDKLLLVALNGSQNYLIRCVEGLFSVKPK